MRETQAATGADEQGGFYSPQYKAPIGPRHRFRFGVSTKSVNPSLYFFPPFEVLSLTIYTIGVMSGRGFLAEWNSPEWSLSRRACETDDTALMDEAIAMTASKDRETFFEQARRAATKYNARKILKRLIEEGRDIKPRRPYEALGATKETLELLLEQGWDINERPLNGNDQEPFMWLVVGNEELVRWCLDHGASVHPRDQEPLRDDIITESQARCRQVLEVAAAQGSVATFELLRSKGAPLGWRPLHLAVEAATYGLPTEKDPSINLTMVRHLLDVVKLDVNAPDQPPGSKRLPMRNGTPICYIPASSMLERDTRDLTWFLLDHGADPTDAVEYAKRFYPKFVEDVEAWKAEHKSNSKCCVQ